VDKGPGRRHAASTTLKWQLALRHRCSEQRYSTSTASARKNKVGGRKQTAGASTTERSVAQACRQVAGRGKYVEQGRVQCVKNKAGKVAKTERGATRREKIFEWSIYRLHSSRRAACSR